MYANANRVKSSYVIIVSVLSGVGSNGRKKKSSVC